MCCPWEQATRSSAIGIPTWSWASIIGPVRPDRHCGSPKWNDHTKRVRKVAEIEDVAVNWSGEALALCILKGTISLGVRLRMALTAIEHDQDSVWNIWSRESVYQHFHRFATLHSLLPHVTAADAYNSKFEGDCCFDIEPPQAGSFVLCLQVSVTQSCGGLEDRKKNGCDHYYQNVLIVQATGDEPDEFRRIVERWIFSLRFMLYLLRMYWLMPELCMDEQEASLHQRMKAWKLIRCICVDMRGEAWNCSICVQIESFPT